MKVVVISIDALGYQDIVNYKHYFPNLYKIILDGSLIKNVETIYPSLTYPIHTTIITGDYPIAHGISNNKPFAPYSKLVIWNWYYKNIRSKTIVDACTNQNKTVSSYFWPVMGNAKIMRNFPEIWSPKTKSNSVAAVLKNGTKGFIIKNVFKYGKLLKGQDTMALDLFTTAMFLDTIHNLSDLNLIHLLAIDGAKHQYGILSSEVITAFEQTDNLLGQIYQQIKSKDDVSLVVLSDHSHVDAPIEIDIERIFKDLGLLTSDDYIAYPWTCDGSCHVYLKHIASYEEVKVCLNKLVENDDRIKCMYDLTEENKIDYDVTFVLEANLPYHFGIKNQNVGQHGFHPKIEDYDVFLIAKGMNIKANYQVENGHVINHAKTIAKIIDLDFDEGVGECVNAIFKDN